MIIKRRWIKVSFRTQGQMGKGRGGEYKRQCEGFFLFGFIPLYIRSWNWQRIIGETHEAK